MQKGEADSSSFGKLDPDGSGKILFNEEQKTRNEENKLREEQNVKDREVD